jgi:maltooligosyltrehalose trehalohydrolase
LRHHGSHRALYDFNRELIRLRQTVPALGVLSKEKMDVIGFEDDCTLVVRRWDDGNEVVSIFNFNDKSVVVPERVLPKRFLKLLDSDDQKWMGRGSNISAVINNGPTSEIELKPAAVVVVEIVSSGRES